MATATRNTDLDKTSTRKSSRLLWFTSLYAVSLVSFTSLGASMRMFLTYM